MTYELNAFLLQIVILLSYIPITFIAYKGLREPEKRRRAKWELSRFGPDLAKDFESESTYSLADYIIPVTYIFIVLAALYGMTQPAIIRLHLWDGLLESTVNAFGIPGSPAPIEVAVVTGRFMFWCWLGAYIQSVDRTIRHYLAHDLSPNVYVFAARRFIMAFVVGAIVGLGVGSLAKAAGVPFEENLTMAYVVAFSIGLFPDQGIRWIVATASKVMRQKPSSEQEALGLINGIGDWQQGRLDQEGISNVQNLATVNLLAVVARTPFDVSQIVDWVDQAILITEASPDQYAALKKAGLASASNALNAIENSLKDLGAASNLKESELQLLGLSLGSATNMGLIFRFHKNASAAPVK